MREDKPSQLIVAWSIPEWIILRKLEFRCGFRIGRLQYWLLKCLIRFVIEKVFKLFGRRRAFLILLVDSLMSDCFR